MSTTGFSECLKQGDTLLFDGSVSTLLYDRGIFINRSFDEVNLSQPDLVRNIHAEYAKAGANILTTNTWGAHFHKLRAHGLEQSMHQINVAGVHLARQVAETTGAWVAGCMGPLGVRIEPWGPTSFDEAREQFKTQAKSLLGAGVDLMVLESFGDLNEIHQALRAVQELDPKIPVVTLMTTNEEGQSAYGTDSEWFIRKLSEWGADAVGVNGGNGPMPLLDLLKRIKTATEKPLVLKPNAGLPRIVDGRLIYMASPEYLGEFARHAILQGARILGGCSGTTPAHIKAMSAALRQGRAFTATDITHKQEQHATPKITREVSPDTLSRWGQKMASGEFAVCLELVPPKGLETEKLIERAKACQKAGIDAINIPDGPRASARMSALATACIIEKEVGIETILHYACRDRNLLGIQSDLIGAAALGLRNILCITGDPPKMGPYQNATAVFDIDAIGLVNMAARLNSGYDLGGSSIGKSTSFSLGVGANPVAPDLQKEFRRFEYKVEAGAEWAITQPVFDADSLFKFMDFAGRFDIPIIAGVWPLVSLRNAEFMANEVPGVYVPTAILERMRACKTADDQRKEGIQIAFELVEKIKPAVKGLQLSAPLGQVDFALQLLK